jgi:hypothetical protein
MDAQNANQSTGKNNQLLPITQEKKMEALSS